MLNANKLHIYFTIAFFSAALWACGGGGEGDRSSDDEPPQAKDTAYARFYNALGCTDSGAFTATLSLNGSTLTCTTDSWSNCAIKSSGSNTWSLSVDSPCISWNVNNTIIFTDGNIYDFVLTLNDSGTAIFLVFTKSGDCTSSTPFLTEQTPQQVFDDPDNEYESMIEIPLEIDARGLQKVN